MNNDLQQLKALAMAATPQNFDSAERVDADGYAECPLCHGDGTVELAKGYCNYDGVAIGVEFYGIGDEHKNAEAYYRAANPKAILALIVRIESLAADAERLDFVIDNSAFICTINESMYQLMTQDEDEDYHVISGEGEAFRTKRAAIDAAMEREKSK
jgi:hypothetical protein